jgi:hypothetical protein
LQQNLPKTEVTFFAGWTCDKSFCHSFGKSCLAQIVNIDISSFDKRLRVAHSVMENWAPVQEGERLPLSSELQLGKYQGFTKVARGFGQAPFA